MLIHVVAMTEPHTKITGLLSLYRDVVLVITRVRAMSMSMYDVDVRMYLRMQSCMHTRVTY